MGKSESKLIPGMEQLNRDVNLDDFEQFKRRIEGDDGLPIEILGQTSPLHRACLKGRIKFTNYLIEKGANVDIQKEDEWCPLHLAAYNGHVECVEALLNAGADITTKNNEGQIALDLAKQKISVGGYRDEDFKKIVELLELPSTFNIKAAKR
eukprot:CAMPEP_0201475538 /NCGR_PEP_ID=MMETSP0151_2-20130828/950_1 /ASSEMBLY_ACC=CAM_ASM_000257 /TAXON_ID=200890 /ORGANISM="Paramoeba atlantica, Strain 621/1 / CCAP 1560/9" /LENGTH=151 /DNA_ID=CAMNT_0047855659 /DNA_START=68 /DNA_END=523 /DNA_ORIENTATION=+